MKTINTTIHLLNGETIDIIEKDVFTLRNCMAYLYSKNEKDYLTIQNDERIISVSTKNISFIESYMKEELYGS